MQVNPEVPIAVEKMCLRALSKKASERYASASELAKAIQAWQEKEINRIRAELVQNEKLAAIGLLSAGVAHEINNPLAFVANNLAVLERDTKGLIQLVELFHSLSPQLAQGAPEQAAHAARLAEDIDIDYVCDNLPRLLSRTREGVERVTRIVHSLRGLHRTDTPSKQDVWLPDLIENTLQIILGRLEKRNIKVEQEYDPASRMPCVGTQIGQVLLNLAPNGFSGLNC
jgi:C4-dicarboxylate-specific signal transduction histidine kinase